MSRLVFGSCSSQHYNEQPLWAVIARRNATGFVWGGDAVYADDRTEWKGIRRKRLDASPDYLRQLLQEQKEQADYSALLQTNISIFGTVDDHDYGTNNGDRTFRWKRENAMEFVHFLGQSEDSPMFRRAAKGLGVYGVQVYDFARPSGHRLLSDVEGGLDPDVVPDDDVSLLDKNAAFYDKRVAVFVLDIRSNRSPWQKSFPKRFQPDNDGEMLGEEQWKWFETALSRSRASVNVVVTGLQVHAERFIDSSVVESWSGFPQEQHRLYQALLRPNVRAPILISGDVHHAQLLRKDCRSSKSSSSSQSSKYGRPLYEITTSGMTHSWGTKMCGRAAGNPICQSAYHQKLFRYLMQLAHWVSPWTELVMDEDSNLQYALDLNVAELDFDWDLQTVSVNILGVEDRILVQQVWPMDDVTFLPNPTKVDDRHFETIQRRLQASNAFESDDWVCVHYRGLPNQVHFAVTGGLPFVLLLTLGTLPFWLAAFLVWKMMVLLARLVTNRTEKPKSVKSKLS